MNDGWVIIKLLHTVANPLFNQHIELHIFYIYTYFYLVFNTTVQSFSIMYLPFLALILLLISVHFSENVVNNIKLFMMDIYE